MSHILKMYKDGKKTQQGARPSPLPALETRAHLLRSKDYTSEDYYKVFKHFQATMEDTR